MSGLSVPDAREHELAPPEEDVAVSVEVESLTSKVLPGKICNSRDCCDELVWWSCWIRRDE
jgi:hypothetical protein